MSDEQIEAVAVLERLVAEYEATSFTDWRPLTGEELLALEVVLEALAAGVEVGRNPDLALFRQG